MSQTKFTQNEQIQSMTKIRRLILFDVKISFHVWSTLAIELA